ncbi:MAG: helix-turn-helix domain-containing protein [Pseudomonadota bacterium]|nr:helix-turn-helix domain-containing protein [Pseudomonadota bacterium]
MSPAQEAFFGAVWGALARSEGHAPYLDFNVGGDGRPKSTDAGKRRARIAKLYWQGVAVNEIAETEGVSRRTVFADLKVMRDKRRSG